MTPIQALVIINTILPPYSVFHQPFKVPKNSITHSAYNSIFSDGQLFDFSNKGLCFFKYQWLGSLFAETYIFECSSYKSSCLFPTFPRIKYNSMIMPHSSTQKQIESLWNSSVNSLFAIVHFLKLTFDKSRNLILNSLMFTLYLHVIEIRNNCKPFTKNAHSENFPQLLTQTMIG